MTQTGVSGERGRPRGPRPSGCRQYARKQFAAGLPAILECFVKEATKGSIPHAKALMTLAGLDKEEALKPRPKPSQGGGGPLRSLSEVLLKELRRGADEKGPEPATDGR